MGFWLYSVAQQACPLAPFRRRVQITGENLDCDAKVAVTAIFKANAIIHGMEALVLTVIHHEILPFLCIKRLAL